MATTIASEKLTNEEVIQRKACSDCYHAINEHDLPHGRCYGLNFNGSVYSSCRCEHLSFEFKIRFNINMNGNQISDNKAKSVNRK